MVYGMAKEDIALLPILKHKDEMVQYGWQKTARDMVRFIFASK